MTVIINIYYYKVHEHSIESYFTLVDACLQAQKEQYLNYRKVFHADTTDVFERRRRCQTTPAGGATGPSPFSGMSNAAAIAMVAAMNKTQTLAARQWRHLHTRQRLQCHRWVAGNGEAMLAVWNNVSRLTQAGSVFVVVTVRDDGQNYSRSCSWQESLRA